MWTVVCRCSLWMVVTSVTSVAVRQHVVRTVECVWTTVDVTWQQGLRKVAASYRCLTVKVVGCSTSTVMTTDCDGRVALAWIALASSMLLISEMTVSRNSPTSKQRAPIIGRCLLSIYSSFTINSTSVVTMLFFKFWSISIQLLKKSRSRFWWGFFVTDVYKYFITAQHCNIGSAYFICKQKSYLWPGRKL